MNKTQTIAGHSITLEAGRRYIATNPWWPGYHGKYPISIRLMRPTPEMWDDEPVLVIPDLDYDQSSEFLREFNNGPSSGTGRVW